MVTRYSPDDIVEAEALAEKLHGLLEKLIEGAHDYDISRMLKRSEAELMDLRHNLAMARRLHGKSE